MPEISTDMLSRELVRRLRGSRSQPAFSKALGFTSNVVYTWESGRRHPEVSTFMRAAELGGLPVRQRILQFWPEVASSLAALRVSSPRGIQQLTRHIVGQVPKQEVAERAGVNRTTLARWLSGSTEPRLPEFLRLVDATTQRLLQFVAQFADPAKLSSTRLAYRDLQAQEKLAYDLPLSHAVLRALELVSYRALPAHDPGFLGRQIGLDPKAEEYYLSELAQSGQIRWDGTHWVVERVLTVDTRKDPVRNRQLKAHWAEAALERLRQGSEDPDALFSFNLFAISADSFRAIRELHLEYYDRVRAIIERSTDPDRVVLMNLQLVPLRKAGPRSGGASS
jgi:transcriptional regulator with XRE-family HTH domain